MLTDYFEPFTLLEENSEADGMGGEQINLQHLLSFRGALTHTAGTERSIGGRMTLESTPMLLHEFDVTLAPGDCVRRERDGTLWRVTGLSDNMRTPALSDLSFAQVRVERLVIPC